MKQTVIMEEAVLILKASVYRARLTSPASATTFECPLSSLVVLKISGFRGTMAWCIISKSIPKLTYV